MMISVSKNYKKAFNTEVNEALQTTAESQIVTPDDIQHLPEPVQKYLIYTGAVGKEKIRNFHIKFNGTFSTAPGRKYQKFESEQYNFFGNYKRVFLMKMRMFGILLQGFHLYKDAEAVMKIKIACLFLVVDALGEKMNQGETVTVFNDMCLMAPTALIDANISWQTIDNLTVKGTFTNGANKVSATLYFNETGELINFISNDRFMSADGKTYKNFPWSTPARDYKDFGGRKVPGYGEAIWHMPEGEYCYGKFNLQMVEYNCG
jgi:hypothetical protein